MEDTLHGNPGLEVAFDTAQATGFTTLRCVKPGAAHAPQRSPLISPGRPTTTSTPQPRAHRFFAHGSDRPDVLQPAPGVYNETMFQALDRAIARAGQAGLKLILTFTNQWKAVDGKKQYVAWAHAGQCSVRDCFYYFNPKLDPQSALFDPTATATKPTYDDAEETQCYQASAGLVDKSIRRPAGPGRPGVVALGAVVVGILALRPTAGRVPGRGQLLLAPGRDEALPEPRRDRPEPQQHGHVRAVPRRPHHHDVGLGERAPVPGEGHWAL